MKFRNYKLKWRWKLGWLIVPHRMLKISTDDRGGLLKIRHLPFYSLAVVGILSHTSCYNVLLGVTVDVSRCYMMSLLLCEGFHVTLRVTSSSHWMCGHLCRCADLTYWQLRWATPGELLSLLRSEQFRNRDSSGI